MAGEKRTGITLQTLHTQEFDGGVILDQIGLDIPDHENCDVPRLLSLVSEPSGQMLVNGIRNRLFAPPLKPAVRPSADHGQSQRHAAKIKTKDSRPDWSTWGWNQICRHRRVLGTLANNAWVVDNYLEPRWRNMRLIEMHLATPEETDRYPRIQPGLPFIDVKTTSDENYDNKPIYIWTCDGQLVRIAQIQMAGESVRPAYRTALKARLIGNVKGESSLCEFHRPLR